jgi:uncharacterized phage protein (TIGR01671 family)
MREIKFRGKRLDNGEWVYGAFVPDELEQTHGKMVTWGFIRRYRPNQTVESVAMYEVDRKTVGQYTGVKDKNGKEIYEDDIVRIRYCGCLGNDSWDICAVKYHGDEDYPAFDLVPPIGGESNGLSYAKALCEIEGCGNIHDNSELLEVGTGD